MSTAVKALTFDVGGGIFNWQDATREAVRALAATRGVAVDDRDLIRQLCTRPGASGL